MSQSDPDKSVARPPWTKGSIALMVIGLLILIPAVLGTAVFAVLVALNGLLSLIDIVLIIGGVPMVIGAVLVDASRHRRGRSSGRFGSIALINLGAVFLLLGGLIAAPYGINALGGIPLGGMDVLRSIWPNAGLVLFLVATMTLGPEPSDFMVAMLIGVLPMILGGILIWAGIRLRRS